MDLELSRVGIRQERGWKELFLFFRTDTEFSKRTVKQSGLSYNLFHQTRTQKPMESGNDNEYNNLVSNVNHTVSN